MYLVIKENEVIGNGGLGHEFIRAHEVTPDFDRQVNNYCGDSMDKLKYKNHKIIKTASGDQFNMKIVELINELEDELCCGNQFIDGTDGRCLNCGLLDNL